MESSTEQDIKFIEEELIPELVFERCFCEPGSREFVELESVTTKPLDKYSNVSSTYTFYRATVVVCFSGEPVTFHVLVKLLPQCPDTESPSYAGFLNEEIFWNKATLQYGGRNDEHRCFPRYYFADMGKYGRPAIVVEDLEMEGYERVLGRKLNRDEAEFVVRMIGRFHGKGLKLRRDKFPVFREFYAKFEETMNDRHDNLCRTTAEKEEVLEKWPSCNICQGLLIRDNIWFKRDHTRGKPVEMRLLDWSMVRLAPGIVDLETLLSECDESLRDGLRKTYVESVREEIAEAEENELLRDDGGVGAFYANVVKKLGKSSVSK